MDEVFGSGNFVAEVVWQKVYAPKNSAKYLSIEHDVINVYAKNKEVWRPNDLPRSAESDAKYTRVSGSMCVRL